MLQSFRLDENKMKSRDVERFICGLPELAIGFQGEILVQVLHAITIALRDPAGLTNIASIPLPSVSSDPQS